MTGELLAAFVGGFVTAFMLYQMEGQTRLKTWMKRRWRQLRHPNILKEEGGR